MGWRPPVTRPVSTPGTAAPEDEPEDEPEEELVITIGPLTSKQMLTFLPGTRSARALDVLLSYFIPLQTGISTQFIAQPEDQKLVIGLGEENACLGFTTYLGN